MFYAFIGLFPLNVVVATHKQVDISMTLTVLPRVIKLPTAEVIIRAYEKR